MEVAKKPRARTGSCRGLIAALAVVLCACAGAARSARAANANDDARPNIIFLLTDDQRFDALGAAGNTIIHTPNMDRLAAEGVMFENMFCTTSICAVSRASFLTGQYARRHGIHGFQKSLTDAQFAETYPGMLREAGYRTGFVGKWGVGRGTPDDKFDFFRGFAGQGRYFAEPGAQHLTSIMGDQAMEFLDMAEEGNPFCLSISFKAPHAQDGETDDPFKFDPQFASLYADQHIDPPLLATEADYAALPDFIRDSEARVRWGQRFANPELFQRSLRNYYRLISGVDHVIGRILEKLEAIGASENTVVILTSDHGFYLGDRGLAGKWFMHEESIRMPLIIFDPRLGTELRGRRRAEMALNIDLAPTILQLAGIAPPKRMQGRPLVPLARGEKPAEWRTEFFYEHLLHFLPRPGTGGIPKSEGVRGERWKYIRYIEMHERTEELYDLANDPHERNNLAGSDGEEASNALAEMRARWVRLRNELQ